MACTTGLGDRLQQTVSGVTTNYTLDLNAGLTQVLDDGTNVYTYGLGRISQSNTSTEYFLGDALGSVRQLVDTNAEVTLAKNYAPYGDANQSTGSATLSFWLIIQAWKSKSFSNLEKSRY